LRGARLFLPAQTNTHAHTHARKNEKERALAKTQRCASFLFFFSSNQRETLFFFFFCMLSSRSQKGPKKNSIFFNFRVSLQKSASCLFSQTFPLSKRRPSLSGSLLSVAKSVASILCARPLPIEQSFGSELARVEI